MKIKYFIIIFLFATAISCRKSPGTGRVEFKITNACFNDIHVSFVNTENADSDNISIIRYETFTIYDRTLDPYDHSNWFTDYNIYINSITNSAGDTVLFDPNNHTNWYMGGSEYFTDYSLHIDETDF